MHEIWRKIPETYYSVSNKGRIRNDYTGSIIKEKIIKGYCWFTIHDSGNRKNKSIHRAVAEAFIPNPEGKPQVNHIDGNTRNNNVDNLEWVTPQENVDHAWRTGLCHHGIRHWDRDCIPKKPRERRIICTTTGETYKSIKEAGDFLDINPKRIGKVLRGERNSVHGMHFEYV